MHGEPANQPMHRYKWAPACCNMTFDRSLNTYVISGKSWVLADAYFIRGDRRGAGSAYLVYTKRPRPHPHVNELGAGNRNGDGRRVGEDTVLGPGDNICPYSQLPRLPPAAFRPCRYNCTSPGWHQMSELPFGNPWHGGKWHGTPGKDTGSYVGGTVYRR